jgi:hypothetical protein
MILKPRFHYLKYPEGHSRVDEKRAEAYTVSIHASLPETHLCEGHMTDNRRAMVLGAHLGDDSLPKEWVLELKRGADIMRLLQQVEGWREALHVE